MHSDAKFAFIQVISLCKFRFNLNFRYWMSAEVQAQVCSIGNDNIAYSCVYLDQADSPGPVTVDIDTPDSNPFAVSYYD